MKKRKIILIATMTAVFTGVVFAGSNLEEIKAKLNTKLNIKVSGQDFVAKETDGSVLTPITYKGRTYLPVRALGDALKVPVDYNPDTNTVLLGKDDKQPFGRLDIITEEYRTYWKSDHKYDTPILIDNLNEFEEFIATYPIMQTTGNELKENYNEDFFKASAIYAYVKIETSGLVRLTAKFAELNEGNLKLFMERTSPKVGTSDMATRVCMFGISNEDIKSVKTAEGIILEKKE